MNFERYLQNSKNILDTRIPFKLYNLKIYFEIYNPKNVKKKYIFMNYIF